MSWRLAEALTTLRGEINAAWPGRSKASDGTIGDTAHAARASDHNPNAAGVVTAMDITHDPDGPRAGQLAEHFRAMGKAGDKRIKYVIYNRRLASGTAKSGYAAWTWRPYTGTNPHDKHTHLSVSADPRFYDDRAPWGIEDDVTPQDIQAIAEAVWAKRFTGTAAPEAGKNVTVTARQAVENTRRWAHMGAVNSDAARRILLDPDELAAAIAEELGGSADSATVQDAVRKVLGSLDEQP